MAKTKEELKEYLRLYYQANKDKIKLSTKVNESKRREDPEVRAKELKRSREKQKNYYLNNTEKCKARDKAWRLRNPEKAKLKEAEYRLKHRDVRLIASREYHGKFKEAINAKNREKYASDYGEVRTKQQNRSKKKAATLTDGYILNQLTSKGFPKESITKELIDVKRIIIKTKRL
jgi:hypothetical protein